MNFQRILKYTYILSLILCFHLPVNSQFYNSGQDPASIHWKQINTDYIQLVFPEGFEKQAQYFTNVLEDAYQKVGLSLDSKRKKISILLHNQSVISNGVTAWAPKRVDMFSTPPQDTYAENWFSQLAIHELRHIVQIEKLNSGLTKILSIILGEQATAAILGLFIPPWFLEGDAVCTETEFSRTGRGRLPIFQQAMKAQLLEKSIYSYEKAVHGSFKDFVPNEYEIGYLLTQFGYKNYNSELWANALEKSAKTPFMITPFSSSIKKTTGFSKQKYYDQALNKIKEEWRSGNNRTFTTYNIKSKKQKFFADFYSPIGTNDGNIIVEKKGLNIKRRFVQISPDGEEKHLLTPGMRQDNLFTYGNNLLCWAEIEMDARWDHRNFSVIKLYDLKKGELISLTKKSRYFSPAISQDGKLIAAIRVSIENEFFLGIINVENGNLIAEYQTEQNSFLSTPSWDSKNQQIVLIGMNDNGKFLWLFDMEDQSFTKINDAGYTDITNPFFSKDAIFYTGAYSGVSNIYSIGLNNQQTKQITDVPFGADYPFVYPDGKILMFSNYTSDGYEVASMDLSNASNLALSEIQFAENKYLAVNNKSQDPIDFTDKIKTYEIKRYSKLGHLFNIHSWAPASINADAVEIKPGLSFMSQNLLSTAFTTVGYEYDLNDEVGKTFVNFSYEGWYPIIDLKAENGGKRHYYTDTLGVAQNFTYNETNINTTIRLPLSFTKNKYIKGIQPYIRLNNIFLKMDKGSPFSFTQDVIHSLKYSIYAYHQLRSSYRDLYPKWGQIIQLSYSHTPFQSDNISALSSAIGVIYFPGFASHHGFKIFAGYQIRQEGNYNLSTDINHPRGFQNRDDQEFVRISVNYKFPLLYPDLNLGSLFYLKRLKMEFFYDYAEGKKLNETTIYQSTGLELTSDIHFLSFIAPFDLGARFIYLPDTQATQFEFLFNINFSSLY